VEVRPRGGGGFCFVTIGCSIFIYKRILFEVRMEDKCAE